MELNLESAPDKTDKVGEKTKSKHTGRKPKLDEVMVKLLCDTKSSGVSNRSVCAFAEISEPTFYAWLSKGEKAVSEGKQTIYTDFFKQYKKAETTHKVSLLNQIRESAKKGNWQAAAWELERCYPEEYGRRTIEVTGAEGGAIQMQATSKISVDLKGLTVEELEKLDELTSKVHTAPS